MSKRKANVLLIVGLAALIQGLRIALNDPNCTQYGAGGCLLASFGIVALMHVGFEFWEWL